MKTNSSLGDIAQVAARHYHDLYRLALSLGNNPADASDLTQQAFYLAQTRGHQLRDGTKARAWLSTTLRRLFLQRRRHEVRFPKQELSEVEHELPRCVHDSVTQLDVVTAREALRSLTEPFRRPLVMFYFEDLSYQQIASTLGIPLGTVMSRLSRGKLLLRRRLENADPKRN
jgi:RNA polymerase sigma-70 factor (ECF subfamily)